MDEEIITRTRELIDELKATCAAYGLGNDGNEYKVITQAFLYKFLNDRFLAAAATGLNLPAGQSPYTALTELSESDYTRLLLRLPADVARFSRAQLLPALHNAQNTEDFGALFDRTLEDLSAANAAIFSVRTAEKSAILLFDRLSEFVSDAGKRSAFCRALVNKLSLFSFEDAFDKGYDFYSSIYEYLIKDYNSDSGGKYAEYFTPHSVGRIMADIMVEGEPRSVSCYDPSAGSGTLLMCLASRIGANRCTVYSQDISQKSSALLRLNLILNGMTRSLRNAVQGNTLTEPAFRAPSGGLRQFDFIVSNPPFKLDFSDIREKLASRERSHIYFAGVPTVPKKDKSKMAIYTCFIQHVLASLAENGKAAIVVPSGFLTASSGVDPAIRRKLVQEHWLRGVVSMPPNIFGQTGTSVSVLFIDKEGAAERQGAILIDASKLGETVKVDNKQRIVLRPDEQQKIVSAFKAHVPVDDFAIVPSFEEMEEKGCSFSAGQYFDIKIEYSPISPEEFRKRMEDFEKQFEQDCLEAARLDAEIKEQMKKLRYE
ncbi:MAG: class I SAM-dependent DNA methyltransferase [Akkermansia sp.]